MGALSRMGGIALVAAAVVVAVLMPAPEPEAGPDFSGPPEALVEQSARASLWYCPWVVSGATRTTSIAVAAAADVDVTFTHPDPRIGEPEDIGALLMDGPGAVVQPVADYVNRGPAPGFVEFTDSPATASAVVSGDVARSGDRCIGSVPKAWHLAGLTTRRDYGLTLRLFNPLPDNAKVRITAASELGNEAIPELESVDVVGKTWEDIDLAELIPFLDNLALTVTALDDRTIIPVVVQSLGNDEASWPSGGLSTEWLFPVASLGNLEARMAVWNPNDVAVDVSVDLFTRTGPVPEAFTATVEPGRPVEFAISDEVQGAVAARVRASGAVAAAVVAATSENEGPEDEASPERPQQIAGTSGSRATATSWLLAGAGGQVGGDTSVWILNPNPEPISVTLQPLGEEALAADKVRVEPNSVRRVRLTTRAAVGGYEITSPLGVAVAWSLQSPGAVAFLSGVAITE